ncbi:MAG: SOS response-associated peptidase [Gemmatimonadales bacterium]
MCGRYTLSAPVDELVETFDVPVPDFDLPPRFNIAPSQLAAVVATDRRGRRMGLLEWGLVLQRAGERPRPLINVRVESVGKRPPFRRSLERRRCLVPADGFYEWKEEEGKKVPHWIHPASGGLLAFAGIWDRWTSAEGEHRHAFAILTTAANPDVAPIHGRMPVIVGPNERGAWLDPSLDGSAALDALRPVPAGALDVRRVSTRVNRATEDDAELIEPEG